MSDGWCDLFRSTIESHWRDGRAAEGGRLEICCGGNSTGGSNPSLSGIITEIAFVMAVRGMARARPVERGLRWS